MWAGRALLYLGLAVVVLKGVTAIVAPSSAHQPSAGRAPAPSSFPAQEASAFAREFALSYLSYQSDSSSQWQDSLSQFAPAGTGTQLGGWDGQGSEQAVAAESWGMRPTSPGSASVEVGVLVAPKVGPERWLYLEVPVVARGGALAVPAAPIFVGGPRQAATGTPPEFRADQGLSSQLQGMVGAFFGAYATSDSAALGYFLAPGTRVAPLGGAVHFAGLSGLAVQAGTSPSHLAVASVSWRDPAGGASFTQDYRLSLTEIQGRWYVAGMGVLDPALMGATTGM